VSGPGCAAHPRDGERWRLRTAFGITAAILAVELIGGWWANSVALLSDAGHVFTDLGALALSYGAFLLSVRPAGVRRTWGWYRLEILAALLNGVLLVGLAVFVVIEAVGRLKSPPVILTGPMLVAAVLGLVGNLAAMAVLYRGRGNLNIRGALLHVAGDTLSSVGVIAAGAAIVLTGWTQADAIAGMLIAAVIVISAVRLLAESVDVLLEATPSGINLLEVSDAIAAVPRVSGVHDLHIWSITSDMPALSGHVVVADGAPPGDTLNTIKRVLYERFSIAHSTLQIETPSYQEFGEVHD